MGATAEDVLTTGDGSRNLYVKRSDPSDRVFPVEKVARVDLDSYQARRRPLDRLGRLDAPPPAAAREEERDVRVLEVDWDDQGERFKPCRSVVAESWNETFKGWQIEGPSATAWFEYSARTTRCWCLQRRSRG